MTRRPGALYRTLEPASPLFHVKTPVGGYTDPNITSVSITRGNGAPAGVSTSTATIGIKDRVELPIWTTGDIRMHVELSVYGAWLVGSLLGADPIDIQRRFTGYIAGLTIDEHGPHRPTTTQIECADFLALIEPIDNGAFVTSADRSVNRLLVSNIGRAVLPLAGPLESFGALWHNVYFPPDTSIVNVSTGDVWTKYAADLGHYIRMRRNGVPQALAHDYRAFQAERATAYWPQPIMRSQCLTPIQWTQPNTTASSFSYSYRNKETSAVEQFTASPQPGAITSREDVDLTHVIPAGVNGIHPAMAARQRRSMKSNPKARQLTIDVLALLRRGHPADLDLVRQLLRHEHGDAPFLGYDWGDYEGPIFIDAITETITVNEWIFTLDVSPWRDIHPLANVLPSSSDRWDLFDGRWNWDAEPDTTTWENI